MGKSIKDKNENSTNRLNSDPNFHSSMEDGSIKAESENVLDPNTSVGEEERDLDDQVHQPVSGARPPGMDA